MRDMSPAAVHKRLVFPQNAVFDMGIDLKRKPPVPARVRVARPELPPAPPQPQPPRSARRYPSPDEITEVVCNHFLVESIDLVSDRRDHKSARARQVWSYLARTLTPHSMPMIGRMLGARDHTTILHGCRRVEELMRGDPAFAIKVADARAALTVAYPQYAACFDPREL